MFSEPHFCHEHHSNGAQHLVVSPTHYQHRTLFAQHMRMNECNYKHSGSHTQYSDLFGILNKVGNQAEVSQKCTHAVGAICTCFDLLPTWDQYAHLYTL